VFVFSPFAKKFRNSCLENVLQPRLCQSSPAAGREEDGLTCRKKMLHKTMPGNREIAKKCVCEEAGRGRENAERECK
jgi:hypothetical protein